MESGVTDNKLIEQMAKFIKNISKMNLRLAIEDEMKYRKENWTRSTPMDHYKNYGEEIF